jgi:hypothetical protein
MSDLPDEAIRFIEAVTAHFGAPAAVTFRNNNPTGGNLVTTKKFGNSNSGVLFKNENKQSDKHADYRGEVNAAGRDYWLDGWVRTSKKGTKFISFKLKLKDDPPNKVKEPVTKDFNDQIPF